jgi:hypothetical protein
MRYHIHRQVTAAFLVAVVSVACSSSPEAKPDYFFGCFDLEGIDEHRIVKMDIEGLSTITHIACATPIGGLSTSTASVGGDPFTMRNPPDEYVTWKAAQQILDLES